MIEIRLNTKKFYDMSLFLWPVILKLRRNLWFYMTPIIFILWPLYDP